MNYGDKILSEFNYQLNHDKDLEALYVKVNKEVATYTEAHAYALRSGQILGDIVEKALDGNVAAGSMELDDLLAMLPDAVKKNYGFVSEFTSGVQKLLNTQQGLGLNPVIPEYNVERARSLSEYLSRLDWEEADHKAEMRELIENNSLSVVDDFVQENAKRQYELGLSPRIRRTLGGTKCCDWCVQMADTYDYTEVMDKGNDVWRRHRNCRCQILFIDPREKQIKRVY